MIEAYKYMHGILHLDEDITRRFHEYKLKKRFCKTATRCNFFSFHVSIIWNSVPSKVVNAQSVNAFKSRLDSIWQNYKFVIDLPNPLQQTMLRNKNIENYEDQAEEQLTGKQPNHSCQDYVCIVLVTLKGPPKNLVIFCKRRDLYMKKLYTK